MAAMPIAKKMNGASQSRRPMNRTLMTKKKLTSWAGYLWVKKPN
jgi:hypothetical protein